MLEVPSNKPNDDMKSTKMKHPGNEGEALSAPRSRHFAMNEEQEGGSAVESRKRSTVSQQTPSYFSPYMLCPDGPLRVCTDGEPLSSKRYPSFPTYGKGVRTRWRETNPLHISSTLALPILAPPISPTHPKTPHKIPLRNPTSTFLDLRLHKHPSYPNNHAQRARDRRRLLLPARVLEPEQHPRRREPLLRQLPQHGERRGQLRLPAVRGQRALRPARVGCPTPRSSRWAVSHGEVRVMDMHRRIPALDFTPESFTDDTVGAMNWRNTNELVVGYTSGKLRRYDKRADEFPSSILSVHRSRVCVVRWNADATLFATGAGDGMVLCWDTRNERKPLAQVDQGSSSVVRKWRGPETPFHSQGTRMVSLAAGPARNRWRHHGRLHPLLVVLHWHAEEESHLH